MDRLKEYLINREYKPVGTLQPVHGFLMFISFVLMVLLAGVFVLFTAPGEALWQRLKEGDVLSFSLTSHVPLLLLCVVFILATRTRWRDLKLRRLSLEELGYTVALAVAAFVCAMTVMLVFVILFEAIKPGFVKGSFEEIEPLNNLMDTSTTLSYFRTLVFLALLPAVLEELFFRGLMMDAFMRWGAFWAIMLSALAFALSHQMLLRIPSMIFVGIIFGWFKYKTGKLTASILLHFIYNCFVVNLTFVLDRIVSAS